MKTAVYTGGSKLDCSARYERILPSLVNRSLLALPNLDQADFRPVPHATDRSFIFAVLECVRHLARSIGCSACHSDWLLVLIRYNILRFAENDLRFKYTKSKESVTAEEVELLRIALRSFSVFAGLFGSAVENSLGITKKLFEISEFVYKFNSQLETLSRAVPGQRLEYFPKFKLTHNTTARGIGMWPWFGRLRRDVSVEALAGDATLPPIVRPVEMSLVPDEVHTFHDVTVALRHALNNCVLLSNQARHIRNSCTLRVCLISHLFFRVIPLPLPLTHVDRESRCFWAAQDMRYETQADLLRLLNQLCRHFACASLSVKCTRSLDATRMLTFACMACICDAVLRKVASDIPSQSSLHYSGKARGPVGPFGFDVGNFRVESEYLLFANAEMAAARTQVLDYFYQMKRSVDNTHLIFKFDNNNGFGLAEKMFIDQLCVQMGFERGREMQYISGEDPAILEIYPEIAYFRDIVFMCKLVMVPTSDALPEIKLWSPSDAILKWSASPNEGSFIVTGFQRKLECVTVGNDEDGAHSTGNSSSSGGFFARLLGLLHKRESKPRAPLSKANPSVLLGEPVESEEDVLHVKTLPDFDGTLGARDCELMLQYLTAPYLRVPLLLSFFSTEIRIKCLKNKELREVLDAALFEPGKWQRELVPDVPAVIPAPTTSHLCTPTGLFFNELLASPAEILKSVQFMITHVVDMDSGKYSPSLGESFLYVLRLAVRAQGYALFIVKNFMYHRAIIAEYNQREGSPEFKHSYTSSSYKSVVRGLDCCSPGIIEEIKGIVQDLKTALETKVVSIVIRWIKSAKREGNARLSCMLHAHIAYIYRNVDAEDLNARVVMTILGSQIYLSNTFKYDLDLDMSEPAHESERAKGTTKSRLESDANNNDLGIPQIELFDMFQRNRLKILGWLTAHPMERSQVS